MSCQFLKDGRCTLAESLAARELGITLLCRTTPERCDGCLKSGAATEDAPGLKVLGTVTPVCPREMLLQWSRFCQFAMRGVSRGLGDDVAMATKALKVDRIGKKIRTAVRKLSGKQGCGCQQSQAKLNAKFPKQ
jgi:hypothetical protein